MSQKKHLQEVFDRLEKANMTLKASKCQFAMPHVKYLGHYISEYGVEPDPVKIDFITHFKVPTNQKTSSSIFKPYSLQAISEKIFTNCISFTTVDTKGCTIQVDKGLSESFGHIVHKFG